MLKKLGANQILGNVKKVVQEHCAKDKDTYQAYSIYGTTNGIKTGTSQFGEWTSFIGTMEAVNHVTGEMFAAVVCFIPEPLCSLIKAALADNDNVEFAFTVTVKRRDDLKEGYEYLVVPHKQAQEADPLEKLRLLVPSVNHAPALEAPKAVKKSK
jgi:hypothetical protein